MGGKRGAASYQKVIQKRGQKKEGKREAKRTRDAQAQGRHSGIREAGFGYYTLAY